MAINISRKDVLWNYLGTFFSMSINFILLPFFLWYFDDDTLGIWYIYMNLSTVANLFTFGFSPSFTRNIAYCWGGAKKLTSSGKSEEIVDGNIDKSLLVNVIGSCKIIYLIISILAVSFLSVFGSLYIHHITKESSIIGIKPSWIIFVLAIFLNLYYGYCNSVLEGSGLVAEKNISLVVGSIVRILLTWILLGFGYGIVGACIAYLLYGLVFRLVGNWFFLNRTRDMLGSRIDRVRSFPKLKEVFLVVWPNAWKTGVVSVASYLCSYAGTIMCSFYLSLSDVGVYSLSVQIVMAMERIANAYLSCEHPGLQVAYITDNKKNFIRIGSLCVIIFVGLYVIGMGFIMTFCIPIIKIIRPSIKISILILLGIGISEFIIGFRNVHTSLLSTMNNVECWKSFLISGCLEVLLSWLLLDLGYGIWGIVLSTVIIESLYNLWHWPSIVYKNLNVSLKDILDTGIIELTNNVKSILHKGAK